MLVRAHKKDWKEALAAYEAHLALHGKRLAGSADASRHLPSCDRRLACNSGAGWRLPTARLLAYGNFALATDEQGVATVEIRRGCTT
jgi:hypothetical protein